MVDHSFGHKAQSSLCLTQEKNSMVNIIENKLQMFEMDLTSLKKSQML